MNAIGNFNLLFDPYSRTYSSREVSRLKEQAAEARKMRDKTHQLQEEVRGPFPSLFSVTYIVYGFTGGIVVHSIAECRAI